ncbi:MAG: MATE family efflux transporter [Spirochaetales bacterium]|nr:MATE family efflux transporter [Spirochaetales bacterium]
MVVFLVEISYLIYYIVTMKTAIDYKRKSFIPSLSSLAFPLIIENLLRVALSSTDVFMLSGYSQSAVAAIGFISQFTFFLISLHSVIGVGVSILIAQYIGAQRIDEAKKVSQAGTFMTLVLGSILAILFTALTFPLLSLYKLDAEVKRYAMQYLLIFNSMSIFSAFGVLFGAILRSYGYAHIVMVASIFSGILNIIGNAMSLYGLFGCPIIGVPGVAFSTVFSQIGGCIILWTAIRRHKNVNYSLSEIFRVSAYFRRKILSIGIPTVGETILWSSSQIVIISMITMFGTSSISAFTYLNVLLRFVFTISSSMGSAVQIKIGMYCGAGQKDTAYHKLFGYQLIGTAISIIMVVSLFFARTLIIPFFTKDAEILSLIYSLLPVCIVQEFGRSINIITIPALKGAGDIKFPVLIGILSMWIVSVGAGALLSIVFKLELFGILCMMSADECVRGILSMLRWKSKAWQVKQLI